MFVGLKSLKDCGEGERWGKGGEGRFVGDLLLLWRAGGLFEDVEGLLTLGFGVG